MNRSNSVEPEFLTTLPTSGGRRAARRLRDGVWLAPRALGALAVLATGAVHLQQFERFYSQIPTIGTLFVLNFAGATAIGLALLAPVERAGGRFGGAILVLHTPLFGFQEPGYDPPGIAAARGAEIATVVFLGAFLVARLGLKAPMWRW